MAEDVRLYAPAALRNREPIASVLADRLPPTGTLLEIASGTGEHALFLARRFPGLTIQPTDPDPLARASIEAWRVADPQPNLAPALALDAAAGDWPVAAADAVLCINMIHISPWPACLGLLAGAARLLSPGGLLYLYGPYRRGGAHTATSNAEFDRSLKERNPAWGVRDLELVCEEASGRGFDAPEILEMPANNLSLCFRRSFPPAV